MTATPPDALGYENTSDKDRQRFEAILLRSICARLPTLEARQPQAWAVVVESTFPTGLAEAFKFGYSRADDGHEAGNQYARFGNCHSLGMIEWICG